jgi:hypothetical protein
MAYPSDLVRTKNWGTEVLTDADLEGQFDLIINWVMALVHQTTGHKHTGASNDAPILSPASCLVIASQAGGDILYASSATVWARLAKGTAGQVLRMNSGATAPEWVNMSTRTFVFRERDTLGVDTFLGGIIRSPFKGTVVGAYAMVETTPTGAALICDVNISTDSGANWNTVLGSTKLEIAAGAKYGEKTSSFDITAVAIGDLITFDIDQIGSTVAGANLTVCLDVRETV